MERALGLPGGAGAGAGAGASRMAHAQGVVGVKAATVVWFSAGVIALGFVGGILGARFVGRGAPAPYVASTTVAPAATPASEVAVSTAAPVRRSSSVPSASASAWSNAPAPAHAPVSPSSAPSPSSKAPSSKAPPSAESAPVTAPAVSALRPASSLGSSSPSSPAAARSAARPRVLATRELKHVRAPATTLVPRRDPPPATDDLRGEIDLIDAARGALRTGTATRALELLGRYAARFPARIARTGGDGAAGRGLDATGAQRRGAHDRAPVRRRQPDQPAGRTNEQPGALTPASQLASRPGPLTLAPSPADRARGPERESREDEGTGGDLVSTH